MNSSSVAKIPTGGFGRSRSGFVLRASSNSGVQFPPYKIVVTKPEYSLRLYEAYPVVKMRYERRDEGFLGLGSYFSGANAAGIKYRETQPIVMVHRSEVRKAPI